MPEPGRQHENSREFSLLHHGLTRVKPWCNCGQIGNLDHLT